jgi:hypothetical protein
LGQRIQFAFDGNGGSTGVGGNSVAPVSSFVLPIGVYLFSFKTSGAYLGVGSVLATGQVTVDMAVDNQFATSFLLTGRELSANGQAAGGGSKIVTVNTPNHTVVFSPSLFTFNDVAPVSVILTECYLTILKLQ